MLNVDCRDVYRLGNDSYANSINSMGQVVGYSYTAAFAQHAFFVDVSGPMQDLNDLIPADSGWVLNRAHAINDAGQIIGIGTFNGVGTRVFLLTPTSAPEPSAIGSLAIVGMIVLVRRRRRGAYLSSRR